MKNNDLRKKSSTGYLNHNSFFTSNLLNRVENLDKRPSC